MDHSIKKKPEKPRIRKNSEGYWYCSINNFRFFALSGAKSYQMWLSVRAALNKHEGK